MDLAFETKKTLDQIELQITEIRMRSDRMGMAGPHEMQYSNGHWPMIELLSAKAQVLAALTMLEKL